MAVLYTTKDGDMADKIAWDYYGTRDGLVVEQMLQANPGLSDHGPVLPAGVIVTLPEFTPASTSTQGIRLWD